MSHLAGVAFGQSAKNMPSALHKLTNTTGKKQAANIPNFSGIVFNKWRLAVVRYHGGRQGGFWIPASLILCCRVDSAGISKCMTRGDCHKELMEEDNYYWRFLGRNCQACEAEACMAFTVWGWEHSLDQNVLEWNQVPWTLVVLVCPFMQIHYSWCDKGYVWWNKLFDFQLNNKKHHNPSKIHNYKRNVLLYSSKWCKGKKWTLSVIFLVFRIHFLYSCPRESIK